VGRLNSGRCVARSWLLIGRHIRDVKCDYYYVQATTRSTVGIFYIHLYSLRKKHNNKKAATTISTLDWSSLSVKPKLQDQDQDQSCKTKTAAYTIKTKTSFCWSETGLVIRPRSQRLRPHH